MTTSLQQDAPLRQQGKGFGADLAGGFTHRIDCPICQNSRKDCRKSNSTGLIHCFSGNPPPIGWHRTARDDANGFGMYAPGDGKSPPTDADRAEWARQSIERQQARELTLDRSMGVNARNVHYRAKAKKPLTPAHRTDLERRGLTPEQIDALPAWSQGNGYGVAIPDIDGLLIGAQIRLDDGSNSRYRWDMLPGAAEGSGQELPIGELPIGVYRCQGEPKMIALVEGTGVKPLLAAERLQAVAIGAAGGQHLNSPQQLEAVLTAYPGLPIVVVPDAGDVVNKHVMKRHAATAAAPPEVGFLWWGQTTKEADDIDEMNADVEMQTLTGTEFLALAKTAGGKPEPITAPPSEPKPEKRSIADQLIDIGQGGGVAYFKTPEGVVYADLTQDGKRQTMGIRSKDFKQYLRSTLFDRTNKSPGSEAVQQAIDTLEALAVRGCPEMGLSARIAETNGKIHIDLADDSWQAVEVDSEGWRVTGDHPARFKRGGCAPMPAPVSGGSLEDLRDLCQFDFDTWVLILCYLVQCLKPSGEYPILCLHGPGGAGKSTVTKMLKRLIDPSPVLTRSNVGDVRQFAIHATKRHLIAIDNLSGLSPEQSDILCRAATGGGHTERTLHSDDEETNFSFVNPLILNGIDTIATRGDLLSRSLLVTLHAPEKRLPESVFERRFADIQPGVFGALLDLLSAVLGLLPSIEGTYEGTERFVGFVELGLAIEQVMGWEAGTVLRVLAGVREQAHETAIESSPIGQAIQDLMTVNERWEGTASALLENLTNLAPEKVTRSNYWPNDATRLSKTLTRLEPDLKALGLEITREKRAGGLRMVTIERTDRAAAAPSASTVQPEALSPGTKVVLTDGEYSGQGLAVGDWVTVDEIRMSDPTPQTPKPTAFAVVRDANGRKHSVWVTHLKRWHEQEADRLGSWEVAS
jgi:hypothetical protein